jgi:hypothetical protein
VFDPVLRAPVLRRIEAADAPETVADALVDQFGSIASMPAKVSWVQQETARQLNADGDPALAAAGRAIAHAIDADADVNDRQPYHGRQHFCEVMLVAATLCQLHRLPVRSAQLLLLAALVHDFAHDGRPSRHFRLELASIKRATPYLVQAGVAPVLRDRLAALVLATEPCDGARAVRLSQLAHADRLAQPLAVDGPPELRLLAADADLARLALLLCEADVLPSVGLTLAHALHLQQRLAAEWGRPLGGSDKLIFVDAVLAAGVIGPFFRPNVLAIRQQLALQVNDARSL